MPLDDRLSMTGLVCCAANQSFALLFPPSRRGGGQLFPARIRFSTQVVWTWDTGYLVLPCF